MKQPLIKSWSYSAYGAWKECAYRFERVKRMGITEPMSWPIQQGIKLHKIAEHYLIGDVFSLPKDLKGLAPHYKTLKKLDPIVEQFWGVGRDWKPLKWKSWVVMKMDSAVAPSNDTDGYLLVQDLKTGNWYPGHEDQSDLYATIGMAIHPFFKYKGKKYPTKGVEVEMWYSKTGTADRYVFKGKDQKTRIKKWVKRGDALLNPNQKYMKSPSENGCRWCPLRSDKFGKHGCDAWKSLK